LDSINIITKFKILIKKFTDEIIKYAKSAKLVLFFSKSGKSDISQSKLQTELDQKLVLSLSKSRIPKFRQLKHIDKFLNKQEKYFLRGSIFVIIASSIFLAVNFLVGHLETVPRRSGVYEEGMIGLPKHINPLYAKLSDVDSDISQLVYSALFKRGSGGQLEKDLVEDYTISDDKKVYTFKLKNNVKWHDGAILTANDIYFTFNAIKDQLYKSSLRSSFNGVAIEMVDNYNLKFILNNPYAAFFELLTFGIMPAEVWTLVPPESASLAELNLKPIGSGPYKYDQLVKEKKLGIIKEYKLVKNIDYYGTAPYVDLNFKFYNSFSEAVGALNNNEIDGISYLPGEAKKEVAAPKSYNYHKLFMPQLTVLFFNQKKNPALGDKAVRQAMAYAINKNEIINEILGGEAYSAHGPILANSFAYYNEIKKYDYNLAEAVKLLESVDWKPNEVTAEMAANAEKTLNSAEADEADKLSAEKLLRVGTGMWRKKDNNYLVIKLATIDREENQAVAEGFKKYWEAVGIKAEIDIISANQMQTKVIKPREFEILFYGQVLGADPDPYSFWHSSQTGEQGLNIADYSNKDVDKLLEDARLTNEEPIRQEKYQEFQKIISEEVPAIFIYSPLYTYIQNTSVKGFQVKNIFMPSDRFSNISEWYTETEKKIVL
jgi:peptide/nickel transport system substrate-binding protein